MKNEALMKHIGKHLQQARKSGGYKSAKAFADKMDISINTYTGYEQGRIMPNIERMWQFAVALGVSLDEICGFEIPRRRFSDAGQETINTCYENMNEEGRKVLESVARSMERDHSNRLSKNKDESLDDSPALGA